jgi:hypothetical protein
LIKVLISVLKIFVYLLFYVKNFCKFIYSLNPFKQRLKNDTMKSHLRAIIATFLLAATAKAQVSNYVFSTQLISYSAITGGTVFGNSTLDDGVMANPSSPGTIANTGPGIPIGFLFTYNNTVYDVFGIDNNGWIAFGQSTITPNPVDLNNSGLGLGISGTSTAPPLLQNRVCAVGRDLISGPGTLRVETIGTSPNRICVIQWANYRTYNVAGEDLNFQIRLRESSNIIDVDFGSWTVNAAAAGQCGLRGTTNADFNNRSVTTSNTWFTSIAGTVNSAVCNWSSSPLLIPNNGLRYEWIPPAPCSGTPGSNLALSTLTSVCPNGFTNLSLANSYTNTGLSYQWYASTLSAVGPFQPVNNSTLAAFPASLATTSWFQAVITCSTSNSSATSTPVNVIVNGTVTNTVPYYEGFENLQANNLLPNCSWSATAMGNQNKTYKTPQSNNRVPNNGSGFANFDNVVTGTSYFYSNGIQMEPGITYSAGLFFTTEYFGYNNWTNLSILVGSSQTPSGLSQVASTSPALSGPYKLLSGTFQVPSSGLYYIAIRANSTSGSAPYLSWDDLSVTIPCTGAGAVNSPTLSLSASQTTICAGDQVNLTANGADAYSWSDASGVIATGSGIVENPDNTTTYYVTGTNTLTGCTSTQMQLITVIPTPAIYVVASTPSVCAGSSAYLSAAGAVNYVWSNGGVGSNIVVTPNASQTYTVSGTNQYGCTGSNSQHITVVNLPSVNATNNTDVACVGDMVTLNATGATTYTWVSNASSLLYSGNPISLVLTAPAMFTVTGTNGTTGCIGKTTITQNVTECTGIMQYANTGSLKVYPNPTSGEFTVELNNGSAKKVTITDVSGRVIFTKETSDTIIGVDINKFSAGIYYVNIQSDNSSETLKVVKQ